MKVACLVMAYRGAPVLRHMAGVYAAAGWDLFVHLDRKADLSDYVHALGDARTHCHFVEDRVEVFWGGFSMIYAELKLIEAGAAGRALRPLCADLRRHHTASPRTGPTGAV